MIRSILLLALGAFMVANAVSNDLCRNGDKTSCTQYCKNKFGSKLINAACKEDGKKRECTCKFAKQESDEFTIEDEDDEEGSHSKHPKNPKPNHHHNNNGNGNGNGRGPKHHGAPSCPKLMPLYRVWYGPGNYQILSYVVPWIAGIVKEGWTFDNQKGLVAVNENSCNGKKLQPIYYVYNAGANLHLFTRDLAQFEQKKKEGYGAHAGVVPSSPAGAQFFCSPTPDPECGATMPLHRYWMNAGRYYYYPVDEGTPAIVNANLGRDDGVLCYVWPNY